MANRRIHSMPRESTFEEFGSSFSFSSSGGSGGEGSPPSIVARAMRASALHRGSSSPFFYAHGEVAAAASPASDPFARREDAFAYEYTTVENMKERKNGFWGVLARKARAMLEDDTTVGHQFGKHEGDQYPLDDTEEYSAYKSHESIESKENQPPRRRCSDALASSLYNFRSALEEGLAMVENKTSDIIQETRKLRAGRSGVTPDLQCLHQAQAGLEAELKASRDAANKMATKAKVFLRELKPLKVDLAFLKGRCRQLERENKDLMADYEGQIIPEADDAARLQLEALQEERAKLAQENAMNARENRFLREIVEYHRPPSMDQVMCFDDNNNGIEEDEEDGDDTTQRDNILSWSPFPSPGATPPPPVVCAVATDFPEGGSVVVSPDVCAAVPVPAA